MINDVHVVQDWRDRALEATGGNKSQFGAILKYALGRDDGTLPRFTGSAAITSDGYLMAPFQGLDTEVRYGAFVGSIAGLKQNVRRLAKHLDLSAAEFEELCRTIRAWVYEDYRSNQDWSF